MIVRQLGSVALLIAIGVGLTGCVAPTASPSVSPSASKSPSPSSTPPTQPELAFGGDCGAALTLAEVGAATGARVTSYSEPANPIDWSVQQIGGLACYWQDASSYLLAWVTIIPAATAGDQVAKQDADEPYCYGGDVSKGESDSCSFGLEIGDWWFAGVLYTAAGSGLHSQLGIDALTAAITPRLQNEKTPVRFVTPGTWSTSLDCAAISARANLAAVLNRPSLIGEEGNGVPELGPGVYGAMTASGYRECMWTDVRDTGPSGFTVEVVPGGAWALTHGGIVGGTPVDVPGAKTSLKAAIYGTDEFLFVTDGSNLLILESNYTTQDVMSLAPAVAPLLAALAG